MKPLRGGELANHLLRKEIITNSLYCIKRNLEALCFRKNAPKDKKSSVTVPKRVLAPKTSGRTSLKLHPFLCLRELRGKICFPVLVSDFGFRTSDFETQLLRIKSPFRVFRVVRGKNISPSADTA